MNRQENRDVKQAAAMLALAIRDGDADEVDYWQLELTRPERRVPRVVRP